MAEKLYKLKEFEEPKRLFIKTMLQRMFPYMTNYKYAPEHGDYYRKLVDLDILDKWYEESAPVLCIRNRTFEIKYVCNLSDGINMISAADITRLRKVISLSEVQPGEWGMGLNFGAISIKGDFCEFTLKEVKEIVEFADQYLVNE